MENKMKKLNFEAIAKIDDSTAIAISDKFNALFRVNMVSGCSDFLGIIPDEKINSTRLYTKAIYMNGKVYFAPSSAKNIAVYSVEDNRIYKLYVKKTNKTKHEGYKNNSNFNGAVIYGKYIFMVPCTYPGVVRIDTTNDQLQYFDNWITNEKYTFRKSVAVDGENFFVPSVINNLVLKFNMCTCEGELVHVGKHNAGCWSMCKVDDYFWMAPQKQGPIIKWNPITGICQELDHYPMEFKGNGFLFTKIYCHADKLYLIPAFANMGVMVSLNNSVIEKSDIPDNQSHSAIMLMFELDEYLYLKIQDNNGEKLLRINMLNNSKETYEFTFNEGFEEYNRMYEKALQETKEVIKEQSFWGLEEFIKLVTSAED